MKFLIVFFSLVLTSCVDTPDSEKVSSGLGCENSAECPDGELCLEKSCQAVGCVTSLDCDLEQFCSESFECEEGCNDDQDCYAGDTCDTDLGVCETYGCRSTVLDCEVGEFCNPTTTECYQDSRGHCLSMCTWDDLQFAPADGLCVNYSGGTGSCQTNIMGQQSGCTGGAVCYPDDPGSLEFTFGQTVPGSCINFYKAFYCDNTSSQDQCPNGFNCQSLQYSDGSLTEPVCIGDCSYYLENGYLP
jgi:hypothetical protein